MMASNASRRPASVPPRRYPGQHRLGLGHLARRQQPRRLGDARERRRFRLGQDIGVEQRPGQLAHRYLAQGAEGSARRGQDRAP